MKLLAVPLVVGLSLGGCASPDKVRAQAETLSSFALCQKLSNPVASGGRREIWAMELHRRGESCGLNGSIIQTRPAER